MWIRILLAVALAFGSEAEAAEIESASQHQHEAQAPPPDHHPQPMMAMPGMANGLGYLASGTALEPMNSMAAHPMIHFPIGEWIFSFHANAFVLTTQQSGPRGRDRFFSTNWFMPMLGRSFGPHELTFRTMLSLEPATVTDRRYPLLFQTGETAFGLPIVDGQHPHDLFMELAARYSFQAGERTQLYLYGGPIGEPALGPVAFPHRTSAMENPIAVLGHHQQDSTHIAASVITAGIVHRFLQWEASTFHGREPDERRWDLHTGRPDSWASRLTIAPSSSWLGQFSAGRLHSPEEIEPEKDVLRTTASIHHTRPVGGGIWASSLIWGRNRTLGHHRAVFNTYGLESTLNFGRWNWIWTRIENVDRENRLLFGETREALEVEEEPIGRVQAYTFGYQRDLPLIDWLRTGLGAQVTIYSPPEILRPIYGNTPVGVQIFLRFRPHAPAPHHHPMHPHAP